MTGGRYAAPRLLRNPHLQSALSSMPMRKVGGLRALARTGATTQEHIVDGGDGVRLLGLHSAVPGRTPKALVLLLHGWEGSVESGYMRHTAAHLLTRGFDVFRLNFRDHGDTHHLNEGIFHSCRLDEVVHAAKWIAERFEAPAFQAAGYSLGGNFALRLALAAPTAGIPLQHAAAVCPAVDPSAVMRALETGNPLYHWYFMRKWRESLRKKRALFPQQHDFDDATLARDMRGLTQWLVDKHTQLGDVENYFDGYAVAGGRMANLQVPVSVLAAADDPIIPVGTLQALQLPAHSTLEIAEHGGHCGFIEGPDLRGFAERWVAANLEAALLERAPTTAA
jgi:predicted alpha/beta-fold hydrolase